jgi:HEAT repeat protein
MQLGRLRAQRAIDPLAATLAGDKSAAVRDAAARALGLIGSPKALPALRRAAQLDADKDVRRSAQFSVEVVQVRTVK